MSELKAKDFKSDQEVRWCPGCGDYAILAALQSFMPELGVPRENIVFVSGIGCAARFPYYMETYGMHSIHGRAPAIATGLSVSRPDLSVWVVTGDGDALSIGGNHLIHALRRNVNLKILLFNNQIYGLTKGQYSPTSPLGTITKSTPLGSLDRPFNPISLAIGAEATFVARSIDTDRAHLTEVLRAAANHRGAAFVEIFQNCNIFNDGAFDFVRDDKTNRIYLEHDQPIRFGENGEKGVRQLRDGSVEVFEGDGEPLVHDAHHGAAVARVRAVAADAGRERRDADRDLPRRRSAGLRRADGGAARAVAVASAARATSRRCSAPARPGSSTESDASTRGLRAGGRREAVHPRRRLVGDRAAAVADGDRAEGRRALGSTNTRHSWRLELVDADGQPVLLGGRTRRKASPSRSSRSSRSAAPGRQARHSRSTSSSRSTIFQQLPLEPRSARTT